MAPVHADALDRAFLTAPGEASADGAEEASEDVPIHFARHRHVSRSHGELAVADLAKTADMAVDGHVIGRVGEDQLRLAAVQKTVINIRIGGIAAGQPVFSDLPDIADLCEGRSVINERD